MSEVAVKSGEQRDAEAEVDSFRRELGPFVTAAEKTRMPMIFTDAKAAGHPIIFANDAFLALTGYDREEVLGKEFKSLLAEGIDGAGWRQSRRSSRGTAEPTPRSIIGARTAANSGHRSSSARCATNAAEWCSISCRSSDLTRHKQDSARGKMMIDELNHRVKNTLSTVQSIITEALRRPAEPAAIREAIEVPDPRAVTLARPADQQQLARRRPARPRRHRARAVRSRGRKRRTVHDPRRQRPADIEGHAVARNRPARACHQRGQVRRFLQRIPEPSRSTGR